MEKNEIRKEIRNRKKQWAPATLRLWSQIACSLIEQTQEFQQAETILLYSALPDEADTSFLLHQYAKRKKILLPVVCGNDLLIREYQDEANLSTDNAYGIPEPQGENLNLSLIKIDLIIVPGMAFTSQGQRLGRGKGFYDRLLTHPSLQHVHRIGLCFPFQLLPELPCESHDINMHQVICATSEK